MSISINIYETVRNSAEVNLQSREPEKQTPKSSPDNRRWKCGFNTSSVAVAGEK